MARRGRHWEVKTTIDVASSFFNQAADYSSLTPSRQSLTQVTSVSRDHRPNSLVSPGESPVFDRRLQYGHDSLELPVLLFAGMLKAGYGIDGVWSSVTGLKR